MDHDEDANGDRREKKLKHTMPAINWNINFYWLLHGCHNSLEFWDKLQNLLNFQQLIVIGAIKINFSTKICMVKLFWFNVQCAM